MKKTVLIVGGTSDIGHAVARAYAEAGWTVVLAARDMAGAERNAADLATRHQAEAEVRAVDILDTAGFQPFIDGLPTLPDTVVSLVGLLAEQPKAQADAAYASQVIRTNFEGPAVLLGMFAERFEKRGAGLIVGVSSVAGDRGRASNYVYGSAKAGFSAFLSGLRNRLAGSGVRVVTIKPGYVRTRMTAGRELPGLLTAEPEEVAASIFGCETGRGDVIYVKRRWRAVMTVIRLIPERIFKHTRI